MPTIDAVGAGLEQRRGVVERADAARGLERAPARRPRRRARDELGPDAPGARAVEVDEVDPPRARRREAPRERDRVAGALDDVVVVALVEPHGALAEHVHGGDHLDRLR